ncbi:ABC transporter ATP-binding protein [Bacillus sp. DJP31]|uniref:ABC transporter ATP-binding protein n=1 Tax=Bacillus sp. DJP31 TaxID=3409789 RepID=UPI003BB4E70A
MENSIVLNNVRKEVMIHNQKEIILDIEELKVKDGEQLALMGPSGSGKTTLLKLISGIITPTSGTIELIGERINTKSEKEMDHFRGQYIGMVFQEFQLFESMSALQNVMIQTLAISDSNQKQVKDKARSLLIELGLEKRMNQTVHLLSRGEKQRVAIARALLNNPKVLLIDEPTSNLDTRNGLAIIKLIQQLSKDNNSTLITVTHDSNVANCFPRIEKIENINRVYSKALKEVLI